MKAAIIVLFFYWFTVNTMVFAAPPIPKWAYDKADKLIASGLVTDKSIDRKKLAERIAGKGKSVEKNEVYSDLYKLDKNDTVKTNSNKTKAVVPDWIERFNEQAPQWIYVPLADLNKAGLLDSDVVERYNLTRWEAAVLTARAYNLNKKNSEKTTKNKIKVKGTNNLQIDNDIKKLLQEFSVELRDMGHDADSDVFMEKQTEKNDRKIQIYGVIRYNTMINNGNTSKYNWNDYRIKTRIYVAQPVNEDWTLHGMIESDKSLSNDNNYYTNSKDGKITFDRYYITGKTNIFDLPVDLDTGSTNAYLADGNILDSTFKGIKISTFGKDTTNKKRHYAIGYGKVKDTQNMMYIEEEYKAADNDYSAGVYKWDNYGKSTNIYTLGTNHYIGNYIIGARYLNSSTSDLSGAANGYVLSAQYGYDRPWIQGNHELEVHYYNMAGTTYIDHTMNGLAGYMNGFYGYSTGWHYTLLPEVSLGIEYYDLTDKYNGEKAKTLWSEISYGF